MDSNLQDLPPLKRFRLLQQEQKQSQQEKQQKPSLEYDLPAKKRKQSREPILAPITPPTTICLPAKKRVWAIQPDTSPIKPISPPSPVIDLNVAYHPSPEKTPETQKPTEAEAEGDTESETDPEKEEQEEGEDDGIVCAVCDSTDGDPTDPIVFCDGCDLMVHASCYGHPLTNSIPEGDWFCALCDSTPSKQNHLHKQCCLCPNTGGAMKPTKDGKWAHIVCAVLVPEVFFEDPEGREGIDCSRVPKKRWREGCYLCGKRKRGCVVECSELKCPLAFHVTCGLMADLTIELKEGCSTGGIVAGFCKKHTDLWEKQRRTGKFKIVARDEAKQ